MPKPPGRTGTAVNPRVKRWTLSKSREKEIRLIHSSSLTPLRRCAAGPQFALRATKKSLNQWLRLGGVTAFDYSLAMEMLGFFSDAPAEGARAIIEKRAPRFG